ncbi:MAG: hypothetical protein Q7R61_00740 [bacterium]|nr:hypothetical protein [bacterium]
MIKKLLVFAFVIAGGFLFFNTVQAQQNPFNIQFPVAELGNCGSYEACKTYCDDPANTDACLNFAEKNGLISKKEVEIARKVGIQGGPGGCKSEAECRNYCETGDGENFDECIAFAEKNGLMPKEELEMVKKVGRQGGPGGCRSKEACDAFCQQDANFETCLKFAEEHDLIPKEELERAKKMGNKPGPGGCRGRACKDYCENPDNLDACLKFAEENGLIDPKEVEMARKIGNKPGPGGCRGEQCKTYCEGPEHQEECFKFAEENGLIPPEELKRAEKFRNLAGPGGCKGNECRAYCETPERQEECFKFAKDNNLLPPEEMERVERFRSATQNLQTVGGPGGCKNGQECNNYCGDSAHTQECIEFGQKAGLVRPEEGRRQRQEFERAKEFLEPPRNGFPGPSEFPGQSGEFPGKPPSGEFPPGQIPPGFERQEFERHEGQQQEGFGPPEGFNPPADFQSPQNFQPPQGTFTPPPSGSQQPSGTFTPPPSGQTSPPPPGEFTPPPSGEFQSAPPPAPTEPAPAPVPPQTLLQYSPFGAILNFFLGR